MIFDPAAFERSPVHPTTSGTFGYPILMHTHSGRMLNILNPDPDDIVADDCVVSLSRTCRYLGHLDSDFYSVAEHTARMVGAVNRIVDDAAERSKIIKQVIVHDFPEAYIGDWPRPFKRSGHPAAIWFQEREAVLLEAICKKFGIELPMHPLVEQLDSLIILAEVAAMTNREYLYHTFDDEALSAVDLGLHPDFHQHTDQRKLAKALFIPDGVNRTRELKTWGWMPRTAETIFRTVLQAHWPELLAAPRG